MMKSSASMRTDSIENQSLPSLPVQRKSNDRPGGSPIRNSNYPQSTTATNTKSKIVKNSTNVLKPELKKINEYTVLKVYEHKNFWNSPSNYSKMSDDMSMANLPTCRSYLINRLRFKTPSLRTHYCEVEKENREGRYGHKGPKGCIYLPKLQADEIHFLQLIVDNNISDAEIFLRDHSTLNINCINFQSISALHIAVHNRSEDMVRFLLTYPQTDISDTVLHAIRDNSMKILVMLLDAQKKKCPGLEFSGVAHSTIFPAHVTPLVLAAQMNHYEIVNLLLSRGHKVSRPHAPVCACCSCKNSVIHDDALHGSCARLSIYRAISSPAYLVHVTSDPILEAFYLTRELTANAEAYRHLAAEYLKLKDGVSTFAVELLGCCRSSDEVELILKQTSGCEHRRHFVLPRLLMAVHYRQKEFVAHPNTQQVLESYWFGDWHCWHNKSVCSKVVSVLFRIFILPLIFLLCMVLPKHRFLKHYEIPLNKLITHCSSYFIYLGLIFYISNQDKSQQRRGPPNTGAEFPLVLYVFGYTWSAFRMCLVQGPQRFFTTLWNAAEVITLILFWLTFVFWVLAALDPQVNETIERKYWNQYDYILLGEGTFCLATIFAFFKLMFLCQLNYHLGPLQVSLGKMTIDIYKYIIVFTIIISAFAAGLSRLYQYYNGMVYEDDFGMKTVQVSSFTSLTDTLNTLFWALFCMAPLESADIVLENTKDNKRGRHALENKHGYTEKIGYFCFGCFEVISVIVVLNMLIATMSNTFQRVNDNVAIEWTFGKTEVYMDYMWQSTLPPPLNLIPTTSGITKLYNWIAARCWAKERDIDPRIQQEFPALMSVLVQRYYSKNRQTVDNYPTNMCKDIELLKAHMQLEKSNICI